MTESPASHAAARLVPALAPLVASAALVIHATSFDFVCDDAFIALRQAENLALHGSPVYNLGERVEVATSPLWALLLAIGVRVGIPAVALLKGLSLASGVLLVFATHALTRRLLPNRPFAQAFALATLVAAAPVAAWSIGGLETPLFAAAVTYFFAKVSDFESRPSRREATLLGVVAALGILVRLELLLGLALALVVLGVRGTAGPLLRRVALLALVPLVALTIFRLAYYGLPLPHTFYAKTAGVAGSRLKHGLDYAYFCLVEVGFFLSLLLLVSPLLLKGTAALWTARFFVPLYIGYVIEIGGDFLDLYRFFVPLFPLLFTTFTAVALLAFERYGASPKARLVVGLLAIFPHVLRQQRLGAQAQSTSDPARAALGVEPIGWTRRAAIEWATAGRWLATVAQPGDTLATGAAGALPYFSRLPNFDLLGLAAPEVAKAGIPLGIRPGHTRYATPAQIAARSPTFLYVESRPNERHVWVDRGYTWLLYRGGTTPVPLLVKTERAAPLLSRADVEPFK